MDKAAFTQALIEWLRAYVGRTLAEEFILLEIFTPTSTLNRSPNKHLQVIEAASTWEFMPDIVAVLKDKNSNALETIFINRTTKSVSLREIGELKVYAGIAQPILAFIASTKGSSNEVGLLMLNDEIRGRCLNYATNRNLYIFGWDKAGNRPLADTILPIEQREILLS